MPAALSAEFAEILSSGSSYQMVARVEVLNPSGFVILDSAESTVLNVVGGSISVDGRASFSRSINDLAVADPTYSLVPTSKANYFSPAANNELRLSVGALINGEPEYIPQGIFHLDGARVEDSAEGLIITLSAYDRARKYSRAKRVTQKKYLASADPTWPGGWPIREAILDLLQAAYPGTTIIHDSPAALLPEQDVLLGDDPWELARDWADSMGYMLFFDRHGQCHLKKVPDPNVPGNEALWTYREGEGGLLGVSPVQTNEGVINGCAVTGRNPSTGDPVRSELIWDDDPDSATYYLGPYGKVPDFLQSDKVRTVDQANDMARAHVNKHKGLLESVDFRIVPNPAIDPLDTVHLVRERAGFTETGVGSEALIVDAYTVNLSATGGAMAVACRQRRAPGV